MLDYIEGTVDDVRASTVVVAAGGIGYALLTDAFTRSAVEIGKTARLYCQLRMQDDRPILYGFSSAEQRAVFDTLTAVSGVGPKMAIAILSKLSVSELAQAVAFQNEKAFSAVSGVGKKTAQRLLLELRGRLEAGASAPGQAASAAAAPAGDAASEALEALIGLGYTPQEAQGAVAAVQSLGDTAEDLVRLALKRMGMR